MPKTTSKTAPVKGMQASNGGQSSVSGRFLSRSEDVVEFEAAARAYTKKHAKSKTAAVKALRKMGMVTATGRLTKRYS